MAGKLVHFELPVQDVGRAKRSWSGVFGWEFGGLGDAPVGDPHGANR